MSQARDERCGPIAGLEAEQSESDDANGHERVMQRLTLEPLRRQLRHQPPSLVLVAEEHARAYSVVLDHVAELIETTGPEVHVQRQGGASALNWQHKQEGHAGRNIEQLTQWLEGADDSFIEQVFLAGPDEARAELRRQLPRPYARKVVGDLHLPLYESAGTTAERIRKLLAKFSLRHRWPRENHELWPYLGVPGTQICYRWGPNSPRGRAI